MSSITFKLSDGNYNIFSAMYSVYLMNFGKILFQIVAKPAIRPFLLACGYALAGYYFRDDFSSLLNPNTLKEEFNKLEPLIPIHQ